MMCRKDPETGRLLDCGYCGCPTSNRDHDMNVLTGVCRECGQSD